MEKIYLNEYEDYINLILDFSRLHEFVEEWSFYWQITENSHLSLVTGLELYNYIDPLRRERSTKSFDIITEKRCSLV